MCTRLEFPDLGEGGREGVGRVESRPRRIFFRTRTMQMLSKLISPSLWLFCRKHFLLLFCFARRPPTRPRPPAPPPPTAAILPPAVVPAGLLGVPDQGGGALPRVLPRRRRLHLRRPPQGVGVRPPAGLPAQRGQRGGGSQGQEHQDKDRKRCVLAIREKEDRLAFQNMFKSEES